MIYPKGLEDIRNDMKITGLEQQESGLLAWNSVMKICAMNVVNQEF